MLTVIAGRVGCTCPNDVCNYSEHPSFGYFDDTGFMSTTHQHHGEPWGRGMPQRFDAIIIGGGHNGLVMAAYLARAGLRTLVLERQPVLGGPV
jgi:hypothetical protein